MSTLNLSQRTSPSVLVHALQNTLRVTLTHAFPAAALGVSLRPRLLLSRLAQLAAYAIIILNLRSLPFGWHGTLNCTDHKKNNFFTPCLSQVVLAGVKVEMARLVRADAHAVPLIDHT
jgi:hypothetical protein